MKARFSRHYQARLQAYLKQQSEANLQRARGMGQQALAAGMQTLDIAKLHEANPGHHDIARHPGRQAH